MRNRWVVRWFRRRALLYHLILAVLCPGCLLAAWWQIHRAAQGNTLSYLYSVEWPIFAILTVVGWWQLIHEDPAAVDARKVERARRAATRGPFVPPPPDAPSGFTHPLQPRASRAIGPGGAGAPGLVRVDAASGELVRIDPDEVDVDESTPVHALSAYNAYLARLAAAGGHKTLRNPRGHPGRR